MLESMGYEPTTKDSTVATSASSSKGTTVITKWDREVNGKASTVTAAATRHEALTKLDAESIAEQILKRAKMADYQLV